ncbi:hypothetical protein D3C76_715680 [compost metagenome]
MAGREQGVQRFVAERLQVEIRVAGRQAAAQLQFAGAHQFFHGLAAALDQIHLDVRIAPPVLGEAPGEQRIGAQQRQAEAQLAAIHLTQVVQFGMQFALQAQHVLGAAQHHFAGGGQLQMWAAAVEQLHVQALLQLGDLLAHRRLAGVQAHGGLGEAALAHHFDKAA